MYAVLGLIALLGCAAAQLPAEDDGSWKPQLDGSAEGNGDINWGDDDGSYRPEHHYGVAAPAAAWSGRRKRSVVLATAVNPNALNLPLDEPITAWAKNAQLVQQASEGTRNILGGGIPLHLPADTPEVAAGKQAHAIAHEHQKALTGSHYISAAVAPSLYDARVALAPHSLGYAASYGLGYAAHHGLGYAAHHGLAYAAAAPVAHWGLW